METVTKILAHRGACTHAPENTLEAFRIGIEQGAGGIELDVHLSNDGEVMVFHDLRLKRMTGENGRICDFTAKELKRFEIKGPGAALPLEARTIPTLRHVYALMSEMAKSKNRPLTVNVELKTTEEFYPAMPGKLLALEQELDAAYVNVIYSSFNHYSLQAIRQLDPQARIGVLYNLPLVDPHIYASYLKADALHPPWQIIAALPQTVAMCHDRGLKVHVWTVNDPAMIQKMRGLGVDAIITDVPDKAV